MAIPMAIYVAEKSFQSIQKVTNHTKAMINSWATFTNENKNSSAFFNPMAPQAVGNNQRGINQPTRDDYEKYKWLFGA
jgi:uncharacterized protein with HEPN domain